MSPEEWTEIQILNILEDMGFVARTKKRDYLCSVCNQFSKMETHKIVQHIRTKHEDVMTIVSMKVTVEPQWESTGAYRKTASNYFVKK